MVELPIMGDELYRTNKGTNVICEAMYENEPCYALVYSPTKGTIKGRIELFDYDNQLLEKTIEKIKLHGALVPNGNSSVLRFVAREGLLGISFKLFVFAHYNGIPVERVRRYQIQTYNDNLSDFNIFDFRSVNLYDTGGIKPENKYSKTEIETDPNDINNKCLMVTAWDEYGTSVEIYDYSEELLAILQSGKYAHPFRKQSSSKEKRISTSSSRTGTMSLASLVRVFYEYFDNYKDSSYPIDDFMDDVCMHKEHLKSKGYEASHVMPAVWNGSRANLIYMDNATNDKMRDFFSNFSGDYEAFAVATDSEKILVELVSHGSPVYYVCETAEQYANLQLTMLGKNNLTRKLTVTYMSKDGTTRINTPAEEAKKNPTPDDVLNAYWDWCHHKDKLIDLYQSHPEVFRQWTLDTDRISITDIGTIFNIVKGIYGDMI